MVDLSGKTALVTGGSRGIGRAIARRLAESGADVAINYLRNNRAAEQTVGELRAFGHHAEKYKANVADEGHLHLLFEKLEQDFGRLDILVSNAASGVLKPAMELTSRHWHWNKWFVPPVIMGFELRHSLQCKARSRRHSGLFQGNATQQ